MAQTLVLDIDYNITKAEAKTRTLEAQWEKQKAKVDEQAAKVAELKAQLDQIAEARAIDNQLVQSGAISQQEYTESAEVLNIKEKEISGEYARQNTELNLQNGKLGEIQANMNGVAASTKGATKGASGFEKSLSSINKRIFGLMKRVFFFSVITKLFRKLKESFKNLVGQDKEMSKDLAQIKGNMAVIGQTLFQTIAPALRTILSFVNKLTQAIAVLLSSALGKDINQMKKLAKESKKVAENTEEAAKSTASFDTINIADDGKKDSGNEESSGLDFSGIDQAQATLDELAKVALKAGAAMVGLGILLIAFGQLPMGIFMIAGGLAMLYGGASLAENNLDAETKEKLMKIGTVAGIALVALGIILLLFSNIPLGIAMIVAGIGTTIAAAKIGGTGIDEIVSDKLAAIMLIAGTAMLVLGIILVCCGIIPLGIGLIVAGAASIVTAISAKSDKILEFVKNVLKKIGEFFSNMWKGIKNGAKDAWENVKKPFMAAVTFFKDIFSKAWEGVIKVFSAGGKIFLNIGTSIVNAFKTVVNAIIQGINTVVALPFETINGVLNKLKSIKILKVKPFSWIKTIPIPKIPKLAEGGVIPGGREFMAVLGDQPAGQTNIEAPLETIKQALAEVLGGYNPQFNVKATGSMSQLIAMLNLKIEQEKNRASIWG